MESIERETKAVAAGPLGESWAAFAQADSVGAFCQSWLAILADSIGRTRRGMVLLRSADGSFSPVGFWPGVETDLTDLAEPARRCLAARSARCEPLPCHDLHDTAGCRDWPQGRGD